MKLSRRFIDPAGDLFSEFDRLFGHAWRGFNPVGTGDGPRDFSVYEDDDSWHLRADLPGFRKEDLDITLEDDVLKVSAERSDDVRGFAKSFSQSLRVSDGIDRAAIAASLEHGILEITLPKSEEAKPKTLRINVN